MDSVRRCLFLTPLQEGTPHHKLLAQEKNLNSASKVVNWIIVDILKYLFINLILSLSISFLLEMVIAKDPSYLSLQYFMYSVTVAYHLTLCSNNIGTHNEIIIDNEFLSASIILLYMYQPKKVYNYIDLRKELTPPVMGTIFLVTLVVEYGYVISLVSCICTRLRLVKIRRHS